MDTSLAAFRPSCEGLIYIDSFTAAPADCGGFEELRNEDDRKACSIRGSFDRDFRSNEVIPLLFSTSHWRLSSRG